MRAYQNFPAAAQEVAEDALTQIAEGSTPYRGHLTGKISVYCGSGAIFGYQGQKLSFGWESPCALRITHRLTPTHLLNSTGETDATYPMLS